MARLAAPATAAAVSTILAFVAFLGPTAKGGDQVENLGPSQQPPPPTATTDDRDPSLPRFRLSDVRKHDGGSEEPWVTHEDKVYDITNWVAAHPGGDVILRAAGNSIDPYWDIFKIHKSPYVYEILSQYLIGYIDVADLVDGRPAVDAIEDPFEQDPVRDPRLITHTVKPRNAEPPNEELDRDFYTPNELFYVRNHMWVPVVAEKEADSHMLTVELPDGETVQYSLADLRKKFRVHRVTAVLQCSGNRRGDMTRHAKKTNGLQWGVGAISNAEWEGVRLADVLADAGLRVADVAGMTRNQTSPQQSGSSSQGATDDDSPEATDPNTHHVQFSGLEAYGASIPLSTAIDPRADVLLAFGMNGSPLPRDHGYPLRAVVPGHVAARSVKWLSRIVVSDEESSSQWQRRDYKSFGPNEGPNPDWDSAPAIQEMPITSAVTNVWVGACIRGGRVPWLGAGRGPGRGVVDAAAVEKGVDSSTNTSTSTTDKDQEKDKPPPLAEPIALQGYAYSGGGREICRVDVSLDGGKTWDQAELVGDYAGVPRGGSSGGSKHWAWKRWRYTGQLPPGPAQCTTVVVKATDDAYNTQPESHAGIYNVRGNLATAWHRVRVCPQLVEGREGKKGAAWSSARTYGCGFGKEGEEGEVGEATGRSGAK